MIKSSPGIVTCFVRGRGHFESVVLLVCPGLTPFNTVLVASSHSPMPCDPHGRLCHDRSFRRVKVAGNSVLGPVSGRTGNMYVGVDFSS